MARLPTDQFDELPDDLYRVGAHRAAPRKGRGWIVVVWAALACVLLTAAGLFGLSQLGGSVSLPGLSAQEAPDEAPAAEGEAQADPVTDPSTIDASTISITVLNGTATSGLANDVGDQLEEAGWPIGSRTNTAESNVEKTTVYYGAAENEGIARGLAQALGATEVSLSDAFPGAPITIVLGSDYTPPTS
ncbi:LytR C-terminal domain-containing protein [Salinibacterium sp. ZJ450]|uniref:LytR C-terminal domain-containing protein n=1 Tax=Salinibacterium sp. ZJ450 TaxID=2708338 RepID=UPI00141E6D16|nr:LytR C-terminal domain-containing protein [Salinibacterium sp. ZJ450]